MHTALSFISRWAHYVRINQHTTRNVKGHIKHIKEVNAETMSELPHARNLSAQRRISAPHRDSYNVMRHILVSHWQYNGVDTGVLVDDQETPLREQAIALVEQWQRATLSPGVRVYLGDRTPFVLTVLHADTTLDDIREQPGIHPLGAHAWRPLDGGLTVHVFDYTPHHDALYIRRRRNNYWS